MEERLELSGKVIIYDQIYFLNINSSAKYVGGDNDPDTTIFEDIVRVEAICLMKFRVNIDGMEEFVFEYIIELNGPVNSVDKNDSLWERKAVEKECYFIDLLPFEHLQIVVLQVAKISLLLPQFQQFIVIGIHKLETILSCLFVQSGCEQHHLTFIFTFLAQNILQVLFCVIATQYLITLVNHKAFTLVHIYVLLPNKMPQTTDGAHNYVRTFIRVVKNSWIVVHAGSSHEGSHSQFGTCVAFLQLSKVFIDLVNELSSVGDYYGLLGNIFIIYSLHPFKDGN